MQKTSWQIVRLLQGSAVARKCNRFPEREVMAKFKTLKSPVSLTVSVEEELQISIEEYRQSLQPLPPNFTPLIRYLLTRGLQTARAEQAALRAPSPPDVEPTNLPAASCETEGPAP
jgi:hypothetical protein